MTKRIDQLTVATAIASADLFAIWQGGVTKQVTWQILAAAVAGGLADDSVTNPKLANMAADTVKANITGSTADPQDVGLSSFKTWLALVRGDVGLGNVDNTSNATERAAAATLTNKTISGANNTLSAIAQSSVTNLTTDLAAKLALAGGTMIGLLTLSGDPTSAMHAATKQYVEALLVGLRNRTRVRVASTANINLAAPGSTFDSVAMGAGETFLAKNQTSPAENGVYVWNGAAVAATRDPQFDTWIELPGTVVAVLEGAVNADTIWLCASNDGGTLGTTAVTWAAFSAAGALLAVNNLSDLTSVPTARTNLGLVIGTHVQAWDADLDVWATKTAPSGTVVGTSDTQTLTGKTFTAPRIVTSILDAQGNEFILLDSTPSAVNELTLANAATGTSPRITCSGDDAVVGLNFVTKGGGTVQQNSVPVYTITDARAVTLTPSVMGALAIDVALGDNTKSVGASTFTYSGTPVAGRVFYLTLTNSVASAQVYTFPSTYSTLRGANITTVTLPASATYMFAFKHDGTRYMLLNEPMLAGDFGAETAIASAATTDLGSLNTINASITGTTPITSLGTAPAGVYRQFRFTGVLTLTHNATSLILEGEANITTAEGDRGGALSLGSGNWVVLWYTGAKGRGIRTGTWVAAKTLGDTLTDANIGLEYFATDLGSLTNSAGVTKVPGALLRWAGGHWRSVKPIPYSNYQQTAAHTGTTAESADLRTFTIPTELMGPFGRLKWWHVAQYTGVAGTKTLRFYLNNVLKTGASSAAANQLTSINRFGLQNDGGVAVQIAPNGFADMVSAESSLAVVTTTIDTDTTALECDFRMILADGADSGVIRACGVFVEHP